MKNTLGRLRIIVSSFEKALAMVSCNEELNLVWTIEEPKFVKLAYFSGIEVVPNTGVEQVSIAVLSLHIELIETNYWEPVKGGVRIEETVKLIWDPDGIVVARFGDKVINTIVDPTFWRKEHIMFDIGNPVIVVQIGVATTVCANTKSHFQLEGSSI